MEIRVLGPVEVEVDERRLILGGPKQRAVLALLALNANLTVSVDRLIEGLWGEEQPASAAKMVQHYVSQLRKLIVDDGGAKLLTHGRGYELRLDPEAVDAARFERLVDEASRARGNGGSEAAHVALALWRGPPLADLAEEPFARAEARRLGELHQAALELAIESDLAAGRHRELIGRLDSLVGAYPLSERLHGLRMLALYRAGRQAEALDAYREARSALVEEVGVEPGPELRRLHEAILRQDPALELAAPELPAELAEGSPALAGRAIELDRLRAAWRHAQAGSGRVLLVTGARGIGKTRLVAELAGELHRQGVAVVYVGGANAAAALEHARRVAGPALVVFDDIDRAPPDVVNGAADSAAGAGDRSLLVVLAYRDNPPSAAVTRLARGLEASGAERLALRPLEADGVREIAALYAGERAAAAPVERLLEASGGLPGNVHDVVADWTRRETVERVGARAGRTAAQRGALRELESELVSNVVDLQSLRERAERYSPPRGRREPPVCPFKGLASYDISDGPYFYGRERLVSEMVARLVGSSLLGVIGPSGSGKSSAVRAGLLPALAGGVLPDSESWRRVLLRPGEHPLDTLKRSFGTDDLAHLEPDARVLLALDQFEETFTACREEAERAAFMDALAGAAERADGRILVVLALRADYYGACAAHSRLSRLLGASQVLVGPMQRAELERAIELPARKADLDIDPELVIRLVEDVAGRPGGLPLLSTALLELWQARDGRRMRLAAYERTRGVDGAVARLAERAYATLSADEQQVARRVLLRLAGSGQGDAVVRRRVPLDELEADRDRQAGRVLEVLTGSRLVTVDEGTAEVAHEALLREWPRLRGWLEDDAEGRRLHRHVTLAARDWEAGGRDPGELYRGARLAAASDWIAGHEGDLNELERAFVGASRAEAEREAERQKRANRRLRMLLGGLAVLLAVAAAAGVAALDQRGEARDAARVADAQRLGAEALNQERLDRALLLTRAAVELDESTATRSNLLSVLLRHPAALGVVDYGWPMWAAAISPDGTLMAVGDERGGVSAYNTATRKPLAAPYRIPGGYIQQLRFSPDGRTLAVASMDPDDLEHNAVVDLIDPRTGERRVRVQLPALSEAAPYVLGDAVFVAGGDLLIRQIHGDLPDGQASPLYRVDGETGTVTDRLQVGRYTASPHASETADRRRVFLTSAREGRTWEIAPEPLRVVRSHPVGDNAGAVSPGGARFALGSEDGRVRLLDLSSGRIRSFTGRHDGAVMRLKFTPDGGTLVTSGQDGQVLVWDVERGAVAERLSGHDGELEGLDLTADGRTLITAGTDSRAVVWDLAGDRRLARNFAIGWRFAVEQTPRGIAVSPDGQTLASTHSNGTVDLIDTETLRRRASVPAMAGNAASVDFSPDGRLLAVTGERGRLTLWDARTLAPAGELKGLAGYSQALAFSPDGKLLAAAEADVREPRALRVWDVRRRTLTAFRGKSAAGSIAFSPDGKLIAAAAIERGTDIRDARTGRLVKRLGIGDFSGQGDFSRSVAFSPGGDLLFVGQYDGRGHLYSTETWRQVGQPLEAHTARITFPEFSPDGRTLVTAAADGTVVLWDVSTQKPIGAPLALEPNTFASAAFSPDGTRLFAVSTSGPGISFDLSPETWKRHACLVAGRELTAREWEEALPGRPYRAVCSGG